MLRLVAHFDIILPGQCLIAWPDDQSPSFSCTISEFTVSITLIAYDHWRMKRKDEHNWTRALQGAQVKVSRDETEHPPNVVPDVRAPWTTRFSSSTFIAGRRTSALQRGTR